MNACPFFFTEAFAKVFILQGDGRVCNQTKGGLIVIHLTFFIVADVHVWRKSTLSFSQKCHTSKSSM